ncbi:MAG: hypothetical protein KF729_01650 [Sandaracinaceae bacterium]|nr:hypothetical protein [Sandaracinaceae bacterium]
MRSLWSLTAALLFSLGCADGGGGMLDGGAGTPRDGGATADAGGAADGGARTDAGGPTTCGPGQHACGAGCIDDLPNTPENGCRFGCGEACPTPPDGAADCDAAGQCTFACPPPFRREGGACVCARRTCEDWGHTCGAPDDGCGTPLDCGSCSTDAICFEGACQCPPDREEPNETRIAAKLIGTATDSPDTDLSFTELSIHVASDQDWFQIPVTDAFDFGNPQVRVTLRDIPSGDDYDLAAYYVCTSGGDSSACTTGTPDPMIGRGCRSANLGSATETVEIATECSGTDESGSLYIHVSARTFTGTCQRYRLNVR